MQEITERIFYWASDEPFTINHVWFSHDGKDVVHTLCGRFDHALNLKQVEQAETCASCANYALAFLMSIP